MMGSRTTGGLCVVHAAIARNMIRTIKPAMLSRRGRRLFLTSVGEGEWVVGSLFICGS